MSWDGLSAAQRAQAQQHGFYRATTHQKLQTYQYISYCTASGHATCAEDHAHQIFAFLKRVAVVIGHDPAPVHDNAQTEAAIRFLRQIVIDCVYLAIQLDTSPINSLMTEGYDLLPDARLEFFHAQNWHWSLIHASAPNLANCSNKREMMRLKEIVDFADMFFVDD